MVPLAAPAPAARARPLRPAKARGARPTLSAPSLVLPLHRARSEGVQLQKYITGVSQPHLGCALEVCDDPSRILQKLILDHHVGSFHLPQPMVSVTAHVDRFILERLLHSPRG